MKTRITALAIAALVGVSCAGPASAPADDPQNFEYSPDFAALQVDASRLDRIDALLQDYVDRSIIPHALTFVAKDGEVIHHKAFGWRDVESRDPLATDHIFRMFSQTKAVTTVALLTLFEQGKFQLDDPVSRYIPEMTDQVWVDRSDRNSTATRPVATPVTIRHLLSHTSGMQGPRRVPGQPAKEYATLEEWVRDLVAAPLGWDPGTEWNYHTASDVWGYLVEYFSGRSLQEYVTETILEPLGITDMAWYFDPSFAPRFVTNYGVDDQGKLVPREWWSGRNPFQEDRRFANAGTGLSGTIEGYARFCQMILNYGEFNGHRILGRKTIEMMQQNQLPIPNGGGNGHMFGIGFQIYPQNDTSRRAIPNFTPMVSPGALSWGGAANTDYIIDHKEKMVIILYTNRTPDTKVWEKFLNTVYQTLE
ncbi:MAG: beta-lactamase family protein [Alistipes sp.]|jgi:CubicO group peptidase (beta-lactamase class C family)|nr:beta-lactamase family protein [Alistipes sp.]